MVKINIVATRSVSIFRLFIVEFWEWFNIKFMKMKKTLILAVLVGMAVMGCKKKEMTTAAGTENPAPEPVDGTPGLVNDRWLKFSSMEDFKEVMKQLHSYPYEKLSEWEQSYQNYESLRKKYEILDSKEEPTALGSSELMRQGLLLDCPDSRLATVLSSNGEIQIADTLYVFPANALDGKSYAVPEGHIDDYVKGQDLATLDHVGIRFTSFFWIPIPRWSDNSTTVVGPGNQLNMCNFPNTYLINWWGQKGGDIYTDNNNVGFPQHNGRTVKLNYHRWRVGLGFYSSIGVRVKMWKNTRLAGWLSNVRFKEASIEACANGVILQHAFIPVPFTARTGVGVMAINKNVLEQTMQWTADPLYTEIFLHHFNLHFRVNYEGHIVERYIRE